MSLFFFDYKVYESEPWDKIARDYKVLARYDLSIGDMSRFDKDENGMAIIPYPPTEEMKNIRMFPPYESYAVKKNIKN